MLVLSMIVDREVTEPKGSANIFENFFIKKFQPIFFGLLRGIWLPKGDGGAQCSKHAASEGKSLS